MKYVITSTVNLVIFFFFNSFGQSSQVLEDYREIYHQFRKYQITDTSLIMSYKADATKKLEASEDIYQKFYLNIFLGTYFDRDLKYDKAISYYYQALKTAKQLSNKKYEALIYDKLTNVYKIFGNDELILQCVHHAVKLKSELGDSVGVNDSRMNLCKYHRNSGNYLSAFEIAFKALEYGETVGDSILIARSNNNIGLAYKDLKEYDKSKVYLSRSMDIYKKLEVKSKYALLLNNMGLICFHKKEYHEALRYFSNALTIEMELNRKGAIYRIYNNIGLVYSFLGNNDAAIELYSKCINAYSNMGDNIKLANLYNSLGTCFAQKFENDSAIHYQILCFNLSEKNSYKKLYLSSSFALSTLYDDLGNIEKSYEYMKKYGEMNQKVEAYNENIHMISAEFEYIMAKNKKISKIEAENRMLWNTIFYILIAIVFLISIYMVRRYYLKYSTTKTSIEHLEKKIETLSQSNDQKNKELAVKLLQLINQNTEKEYLVIKLKQLKSNVGVNSKFQIQELINEINLKIDKDLWGEFEVRFTNIHSDFYSKLLSENPNLTQGEKRLCFLLYLNFSPKEISVITKHSYRSILVAKYRLKNKLQLSKSEELTNYLHQIS